MEKFQAKNSLLALSLILLSGNAFAVNDEGSHALANTYYAGILSGWGSTFSNGTITQTGTAFFPAGSGGPLAVNASGDASKNSAWLAGLHIGHEWRNSPFNFGSRTWKFTPGAELEGFYLKNKLTGFLNNPTNRLPEHLFDDSFSLKTGVILANSTWIFNNSYTNTFQPYLGVGVGAARISVTDANSVQDSPAEPGINHFNSDTSNSTWTFAAQVKLGLRFDVARDWRIFGEYRYLHLASSSYTFGSTQYPTHVATTNWNVDFDSMNYNLGVLGLEYKFG